MDMDIQNNSFLSIDQLANQYLNSSRKTVKAAQENLVSFQEILQDVYKRQILSVSWRIPERSSFPEVEVTRSLSSNLLKRGFTQLVEEDARVINTNDLVAKRIRELAAKMQQDEGTGFISGLAADKVEALVTDTGDGEENPQTSGNVIKAGEDLQKLKEEAEAEAQKIIEDAKAKAESILADARAQARCV